MSGLSRAETARFDAILWNSTFDLGADDTPRSGNGLKVIRQHRALGVAAPILMFTAAPGESYETTSLDASSNDFLLRTVSIPSVVSRIRALIPRHEQGLDKRELESVPI